MSFKPKLKIVIMVIWLSYKVGCLNVIIIVLSQNRYLIYSSSNLAFFHNKRRELFRRTYINTTRNSLSKNLPISILKQQGHNPNSANNYISGYRHHQWIIYKMTDKYLMFSFLIMFSCWWIRCHNCGWWRFKNYPNSMCYILTFDRLVSSWISKTGYTSVFR